MICFYLRLSSGRKSPKVTRVQCGKNRLHKIGNFSSELFATRENRKKESTRRFTVEGGMTVWMREVLQLKWRDPHHSISRTGIVPISSLYLSISSACLSSKAQFEKASLDRTSRMLACPTVWVGIIQTTSDHLVPLTIRRIHGDGFTRN